MRVHLAPILPPSPFLSSSTVHPIEVKAELWNQVGMNLITSLSKYPVVIGISLLLQSIFESGLRQVLFLIKQWLEWQSFCIQQ